VTPRSDLEVSPDAAPLVIALRSTLELLDGRGGAGDTAAGQVAREDEVDADGAARRRHSRSTTDFNFKSLRLNAVFRWEMKPGSALYAVGTRQQVDTTYPGVFVPGRDMRALFGAGGDDVFLVKMAYWLGR